MTSVKLISYTCVVLSAIVFSASVSAGTINYNWAGAGAGGTGAITFYDTNISDPENFSVAFDTENVANIIYTFENGTSIENADNFSGGTTLQALTELGGAIFTATDGVIEGWTFNYDTVYSILPLDISFTGSSTTSTIFCFTAPCPVDTADINFIGNFATESNLGSWQLQAVPLPAAVWLFTTGLVGFAGFVRISKKLDKGN